MPLFAQFTALRGYRKYSNKTPRTVRRNTGNSFEISSLIIPKLYYCGTIEFIIFIYSSSINFIKGLRSALRLYKQNDPRLHYYL